MVVDVLFASHSDVIWGVATESFVSRYDMAGDMHRDGSDRVGLIRIPEEIKNSGMSRRDYKLQAQSWVDHPGLMAKDLRQALDWLRDHAVVSSQDEKGLTRWIVPRSGFSSVVERLRPLSSVLSEYRRMQAHTTFNIDLFRQLLEAIADAADDAVSVPALQFELMNEQVSELERWAGIQAKRNAEPALRSESLKAVIEVTEDEIILRTDIDGSIKIRGAVHIPMFLAFWRAPGHRLGRESFLDIDRSSNPKGLERHRARLSGRLLDVLLEIAEENGAFRLRRCRR